MTNTEYLDIVKQLYSRLKRQVFIQELSRKGLVFIDGNDKIRNAYTFSLPAGWSCPGASACLSKAYKQGGGLQDGPNCEFRCFAASEEARLTEVRLIRWHNFDLLLACKSVSDIVNLITASIPGDAEMIRVHVSGDYYNETYFLAWLEVARLNPHIIFYSYTKSIPTLLKYRNQLPSNFRITASFGGKHDNLIIPNGLLYSKVVKDEAEAAALGLEVDHDDTHAQENKVSFALIVHAAQPAGSEYSKAWAAQVAVLKANNKNKVKRIAKPVSLFQWAIRILKLVNRLRVAGGVLNPEDAILVASLVAEAGVVAPPAGVGY